MGCSSSNLSAAKPKPAPHAPKPHEIDRQKTPADLISELVQHKPVDASDVVEITTAKDEIKAVRKFAKQFLDSVASVSCENDANTDIGAEVYDEGDRGALYEKQDQDFTKYQKESYPKSDEVRALILNAMRSNPLFENEEQEELIELIDLFKPVTFSAGDCAIKQGDRGDQFYVVEYGKLSINAVAGESKSGKKMKIGDYSSGSSFGEGALIFDSPRAASVTATTDAGLWTLKRQDYRLLIGYIRYKLRREKLDFLRNCEIRGRHFSDIFDGSQIEDLSIAIKTDHYERGSVIVREGEMNDTLYIVCSGTVDMHQWGNYQKVGCIHSKQSFGTNALLTTMASQHTFIASSPVTLYFLTRKDFETMIGNMQDALDGQSITRSMLKDNYSHAKTTIAVDRRYDLTLNQLSFFNALGRGAFGKVFLVQSKENKKLFALKAQSKNFIITKSQTEHVLNEYRIMKQLEHPNILNIHCAMQDNRYLFFLLDLHPGGELMNYLKKWKRFSEDKTRFYAASVVLAFEHLHTMLIAYRDLKPENIVLDKNGFGILVDFGLAKEIDEGHTYTLCGTPDYLAPEVLRGTGHDWAVDYWSLGVLLFELTNGCAPFYANHQLRRQRKILQGYEYVDVPAHFSHGLRDLIAKLLVNDQAQRIGRNQVGIRAIKMHIFFTGFDWEGLLEKRISSPIKPPMPADIKTIGKPHLNEDIFAESSQIPTSDWWPDLESWE